jgi:hypothetical protein
MPRTSSSTPQDLYRDEVASSDDEISDPGHSGAEEDAEEDDSASAQVEGYHPEKQNDNPSDDKEQNYDPSDDKEQNYDPSDDKEQNEDPSDDDELEKTLQLQLRALQERKEMARKQAAKDVERKTANRPSARGSETVPKVSNSASVPKTSKLPPVLRASKLPPVPKASKLPSVPKASKLPPVPKASKLPPVPKASKPSPVQDDQPLEMPPKRKLVMPQSFPAVSPSPPHKRHQQHAVRHNRKHRIEMSSLAMQPRTASDPPRQSKAKGLLMPSPPPPPAAPTAPPVSTAAPPQVKPLAMPSDVITYQITSDEEEENDIEWEREVDDEEEEDDEWEVEPRDDQAPVGKKEKKTEGDQWSVSSAALAEVVKNIDAREKYHQKCLDMCARDRVLLGVLEGHRRDRPVRNPEAEYDVKPIPRPKTTKPKRPKGSRTTQEVENRVRAIAIRNGITQAEVKTMYLEGQTCLWPEDGFIAVKERRPPCYQCELRGKKCWETDRTKESLSLGHGALLVWPIGRAFRSAVEFRVVRVLKGFYFFIFYFYFLLV